MATFLDLPTELIDGIFEGVSFRGLAALSLTSKKLHRLATPHLYSCIDFEIYLENPRPIIRLTRSIFNNPELAQHIRSVRLRDGDVKVQGLFKGYAYEGVPVSPQSTDEDGMPEFIDFIKKTGLSFAGIWIDKLRVADLNAFVALLLSRLPNLKSFRIGYAAVLPYIERTGQRNPPNIAGENQFLGKLFQSAMSKSDYGLSRFQELEEISFPGPISVDPGRNPDFCNPYDMVALLNLPSIRSIRGWCWNPSSLPFAWTDPPDPVHLTSLTLSYVHVDFLAQILATTHALKTLHWKWKWIQSTHPLNTDTIDLGRFVEAVQPIQDTLEDLSIGFEFDDMSWGGTEPGMMKALGTLHGLGGFANIKRFQAPLGTLLPDWDCNVEADPTRRLEDSLPRNVEVVTVTDAFVSDYYTYDEFEELDFVRAWLHETASTRTPRLKEVRYLLVREGSDIAENDCAPIKQVFEGTNLEYRIIEGWNERPWEAV